jgi:hypothetical protein
MDSMTYTVTDGRGGEDTALVRIAVYDARIEGDIDDEESVDLTDAVKGLQIVAGSALEKGTTDVDADVDADGNVGMEEVIFVLQKISGLR